MGRDTYTPRKLARRIKKTGERIILGHYHYYQIGDKVIDEDGCKGYVCIRYEDGDLCFWENDAAHPNPKKCKEA